MSPKNKYTLIIGCISALLISLHFYCTSPTAGSEVGNEETIALSGRVLNQDSTGIANIVAKLAVVGLSDTTDNNGFYKIKATHAELTQMGINLDTIQQDSVQIIKENTVVKTLKVNDWIDTLPYVFIIQRNIEGILLTTDTMFKSINVILSLVGDTTGDSAIIEACYIPATCMYSCFAYFHNVGRIRNNNKYSVYVKVLNKDSLFTGHSRIIEFNDNAGDITILSFNPYNATPKPFTGNDTTVSINDSIMLKGTAIDSFGGFIERWEWNPGGKGTFLETTPDSCITIKAPAKPDSNYTCILQVTDNDGNKKLAVMNIKILLDAPAVMLQTTTPVVSISDTILLNAKASDGFGSIIKWEWCMGDSGIFIESPDGNYKALAPGTPESLYQCIVRVTDDDSVTSEDTLRITVILDIPRVTAYTATPSVSINDTVLLYAEASDSFGSITKWEWCTEYSDDFIETPDSNYKTVAPGIPDSNFYIIVRVTDDDDNIAHDTVTIIVEANTLTVTAFTSTPTVSINDTIKLCATASNPSGSVVKWEWNAGNTGDFTVSPDSTFKTIAPSTQDNSYECVVRVTDDDGNIALDTVSIDVVLPPGILGYITAQLKDSLHTNIIPVIKEERSSVPSFNYPTIGGKNAISIDACAEGNIWYCDKDSSVWHYKNGSFQLNNIIVESIIRKGFDICSNRNNRVWAVGEIMSNTNYYMHMNKEWSIHQGILKKIDVSHSEDWVYCIGSSDNVHLSINNSGWQGLGGKKALEITRGENVYIVSTDNKLYIWSTGQSKWDLVTGPFDDETLVKVESNENDEIIVIDDKGTAYYKDSNDTWYTIQDYGIIDHIYDITLF